MNITVKIRHFILTIAALGALASCNYEYPEIDFSQTYMNDYSEVAKTLQDQSKTLSEKLAALQTAMSNQTMSLEQKLDLLKKAIDDQNMTLSQKMELLTSAVDNGVIKYEEMAKKIIEAIDAMAASSEEKMAAIEEAVKAQTADLSAKLALVEAALQKGFVDTAKSVELVKEAVASLEGTVEEKLKAIEEAVNNQKIELSAKLALIQGTVEAGFADNAAALEYVADAIESLEGTLEEKLGAIENIIKSQTTELGLKLSLIEAAVKNGFADNAKAIGLVKDAISSLDGATEEKLNGIEEVIKSQITTLTEKLALIDGALTTGLTNIDGTLKLIKDAVASLKGDYADALKQIEDAVKSMSTALETKLAAIKASVDNGILDIVNGQKQIEAAIEKASAESVVSGFNKDQILGLDLTKGCAIVTTDFWSKYYNSEGSDYYKKVSALLDVTLPIPNSLSINLHLRGFQYDDYPKYDQSAENYEGCAKNCNITTRIVNNSPRLMVANVDSDWAEYALTNGTATSGLMAYSNNFAFEYKGRSACAVYKVIPYANINYHRNRMKEVEVDEDGQVIEEEYAMVAAVFNVYCNKNSNSSATTQLADDFHAQAEAYIFYPTAEEDDSFVVNLSGNSMIVDGKFNSGNYDQTLKYLFPYTDYRYGKTLEVEAIYQTGGRYD